MDIAIAIESLVPAAKYGGSTNGNTQADYDALVWKDARVKPAWSAIQAADTSLTTAMATEVSRKAGFAADTGAADLINRAKTSTVAQIDSWLTTNVTTLPQARAVLAAVIKVLATMVR